MAFLNSGEIRSKKQSDNEIKKMWAMSFCIEIIFSGTVFHQIPKIALVRYNKIKWVALFRKQCCNEQYCIDLD